MYRESTSMSFKVYLLAPAFHVAIVACALVSSISDRVAEFLASIDFFPKCISRTSNPSQG